MDERLPELFFLLKGSIIKTITNPHCLLPKQLDAPLVVIMVGVVDGRILFQPFKHDVLLGLDSLSDISSLSESAFSGLGFLDLTFFSLDVLLRKKFARVRKKFARVRKKFARVRKKFASIRNQL